MLTKSDIKQLKEVFATKDDLRKFATKDDLRKFATKDDLRKFATKDDLKKFATKDDLNKFATKDEVLTRLDAIMAELQAMREEMTVFAYRQSNHSDRIEKLEMNAFGKSFA